MSAGPFPHPVRRCLAQVNELRFGDAPDMAEVGRLLLELATEEEYFAPLIAQMPAGSPGVHWLARPERGPRLVLVHRPEGGMAYTHSHACLFAAAPVRGGETHPQGSAVRPPGGRPYLSLADQRARRRGYGATLIPREGL